MEAPGRHPQRARRSRERERAGDLRGGAPYQREAHCPSAAPTTARRSTRSSTRRSSATSASSRTASPTSSPRSTPGSATASTFTARPPAGPSAPWQAGSRSARRSPSSTGSSSPDRSSTTRSTTAASSCSAPRPRSTKRGEKLAALEALTEKLLPGSLGRRPAAEREGAEGDRDPLAAARRGLGEGASRAAERRGHPGRPDRRLGRRDPARASRSEPRTRPGSAARDRPAGERQRVQPPRPDRPVAACGHRRSGRLPARR